MSIERPPFGAGKKEPLSLDSAASHLLEECRMVLPGIQALFGFQLIAVFNEGFTKRLSGAEQHLHLAALLLVTAAIVFVMAPAAIHRMTSQREVSERFVWLASRLMLAGMVPLLVGLCIDIYLVSAAIAGDLLAFAAASLAFLFGAAFWFLLPLRERGKIGR
jgi:hypothetical protein